MEGLDPSWELVAQLLGEETLSEFCEALCVLMLGVFLPRINAKVRRWNREISGGCFKSLHTRNWETAPPNITSQFHSFRSLPCLGMGRGPELMRWGFPASAFSGWMKTAERRAVLLGCRNGAVVLPELSNLINEFNTWECFECGCGNFPRVQKCYTLLDPVGSLICDSRQ